jgi:hypothetical protein
MRASPLKDSMNAGEMSPLMAARIRVEKYSNALKTCENMIPLVQGGVTRRSGTMYVSETKQIEDYVIDDYWDEDYVETASGMARLIPFEFSVTQAYVLEFGGYYIRFYKDNGQIQTSGVIAWLTGTAYVAGDLRTNGGVTYYCTTAHTSGTFATDLSAAKWYAQEGTIYEIITPYAEADISSLKYTQSADILYITHPSYAPRKLSRTGHTSWTLTVIDFLDGPYLNTNITTTTITPSGTTGTITLTASAVTGINNNTGFAATDVGRLVRMKHSSTWGYAKITVFTSATLVSADVKSTLGGTGAVTEWRLGVYNSVNGYPSCCMFFEDRLFFAGCTAFPQRIDGSSSSLYETFAPSKTDGTIVDSNAVAFALNASDVNVIRWMMDDEKGLLIGTVGGEWMLRPSSTSQALTPTNVTAKRSTAFGSANIQAVRAGRASIYIQRSGRKVRELAYVYEVDGFRSPDMTILSEHISESGLVSSDYQQEPFSIVWFVRTDGVLVGMTYERDQDVVGWHRHILGGSFGSGNSVVESVACIPTPDGTADEAWLLVKRTIDGTTRRYIEYIDRKFIGTDTTDAYYVDCGLTYDGVAATVISGLDHLEGQTVQVLADGSAHPDCVVSSGSITLNRSSSVVHIGLKFISNVQTLNIEAGATDGTSQGKTKRIHRVTVRLNKTLGMKYGPNANELDVLPFRTTSDLMGNPPSLYTGDKEINWNAGYETEGSMYFRQDQPLPFTLLGIFPQLLTQDR